jgi:hypothetical protein
MTSEVVISLRASSSNTTGGSVTTTAWQLPLRYNLHHTETLVKPFQGITSFLRWWEMSNCSRSFTTTQNSWISGLCPPPGILNTRKHDVSETGCVSVLRWGGGETPTLLGPLERAKGNHWTGLILLYTIVWIFQILLSLPCLKHFVARSCSELYVSVSHISWRCTHRTPVLPCMPMSLRNVFPSDAAKYFFYEIIFRCIWVFLQICK